MHGLGSCYDDEECLKFQKVLENNIDRTAVDVVLIDAYNGYPDSTTPLSDQVPDILKQVKETAEKYDKVIAVGHSQGGIIWRGMIENWDNHNVHTFISLASPQHGVANIPKADVLEPYIKQLFKDNPIKLLMALAAVSHLESVRSELNLEKLIDFEKNLVKVAQEVIEWLFKKLLTLAPFNYYFDPTQHDLYLEKIQYFPEINNEKPPLPERTEEQLARKANFLLLQRLVMIGGPDDEIVVPWQSEHFGYFDKDGLKGNILDMTESELYKGDLFGLKTLNEDGRIKLHTVEGVGHQGFECSEKVLKEYVVPEVEEVLKSAENSDGTVTSLKVGVLFMHGLTGSSDSDATVKFKEVMENNIDTTAVEIRLIDAYNNWYSAAPLSEQVPDILKKVKDMVADAEYDKVIAVGHSQGGVIWRGMIENWDKHNVHTFITLASPQHGVANVPPLDFLDDYINDNFKDKPFRLYFLRAVVCHLKSVRLELTLDDLIKLENILKEIAKEVIEWFFQMLLMSAPFNYNFDSTHYDLYLEKIQYFPEINNEKPPLPERTEKQKARKANFLLLERMVMIGGPQDGWVVPWQSEHFGCFDEKGENVLDMTETEIYKRDLFGLKTLSERDGKTIKRITVENMSHHQFVCNEEVLTKYVVPEVEDVLKSVANCSSSVC